MTDNPHPLIAAKRTSDNPYEWRATAAGKADVDGDWKVHVDGQHWADGALYATDRPAAEDLAARINGTNQPAHAVRGDLLDGTWIIRHWLVGRTVDSVGLAAELRQWADTFQPLEDQPTDLPDGASPWLGDEADAVALGRIVQTLPDDEWERSLSGRVRDGWLVPNAIAMADRVYLLRRKPQTVTVELPKDATDEQILTAAREALDR